MCFVATVQISSWLSHRWSARHHHPSTTLGSPTTTSLEISPQLGSMVSAVVFNFLTLCVFENAQSVILCCRLVHGIGLSAQSTHSHANPNGIPMRHAKGQRSEKPRAVAPSSRGQGQEGNGRRDPNHGEEHGRASEPFEFRR